jgi:hypothetical protein
LWSLGKLFLGGVISGDAFIFQLQLAILPASDILLSGEKSIENADGGKVFLSNEHSNEGTTRSRMPHSCAA